MRLYIDYRGLNKITIKNRYLLPLISELLNRLSYAVIFTKLDLRDAYYRIRIKAEDEQKTAFKTKYGLFKYLVMLFRLANAPATFQAYINRALGGLVDTICIVYLNDILIYSRSEADYKIHVKQVLQRLQDQNLYVKVSKCTFNTYSVNYLRYIITLKGVVIDEDYIKTILEQPNPRSFYDI